MGLIQTAQNAVSGVLLDQWREYFYCEAIPVDILAVRGKKRTGNQSSNAKESDNIISNGSIIAVADGQCMMIVEQEKIVDICAQPGEYTYDYSTEPSLLYGDLSETIPTTFQNIGKQFTFDSKPTEDQRIYYFNTKELIGNKYGTLSPIPFHVVDECAGTDTDIHVRCFGEYSYRLVNPMLFYPNVCGNMCEAYSRSQLDEQLKSELLAALQPAFAKISEMGIRYSDLPGHTQELATVLQEELSKKWKYYRGIEIQNIVVSSVTANEEDIAAMKDMQREARSTDTTRSAAHIINAQAAASTSGGAASDFMGMGMARNSETSAQPSAPAPQLAATAPVGSWKCTCGAVVTGNFCPKCGTKKPITNDWTCSCGQSGNTGKFCLNCGSPQPAPAAPAGSWKCICGTVVTGNFCPECGTKKLMTDDWTCSCGQSGNTGKFCPNCGSPQPIPAAPAGSWKCTCGTVVTGNFCPECGTKKPMTDDWICRCGAVNKGKFCPECGRPKPADVPQYRCNKCGWEPEDRTKPPKFCPQCGDPFDEADLI